MTDPTEIRALAAWLEWMGTGGHPDQINPDERYVKAATVLSTLSTENAELKRQRDEARSEAFGALKMAKSACDATRLAVETALSRHASRPSDTGKE